MTPAARLLLRALCEYPDDDAPRAMFADELQSSDDPHESWLGRFVAAQLAGRDHPDGIAPRTVLGPSASALGKYGVKLFSFPNVYTHGITYWSTGGWTSETEWSGRDYDVYPVFHVNRGFVFHAELSCADFMKCAGPLYARHPMKYGAVLRDKTPRTSDIESRRYGFSTSDDGAWEAIDNTLPKEIFQHLPLAKGWQFWKFFPTMREACNNLTAACAAHGRAAAALYRAANPA